MIDLWPDDIEHTSLKAPVTILKEQGAVLGRKTSNLVEGEIFRRPAPFMPGLFQYTFSLVAPALGHYSYQLLRISHSLDFYPLEIETEEDVLGELPAEMKGEDNKLVADSQDRFMEILRAIFATTKARRVIGAIITQSEVGIEQG